MRMQLRKPFFLMLSSLVFDWQARMRIAGTNMNYHFFAEMGVLSPDDKCAQLASFRSGIGLGNSSSICYTTRVEVFTSSAIVF